MSSGKRFDKKLMLEMFDDGMSYEEIAKKLNAKSVQSVRHAIERENRLVLLAEDQRMEMEKKNKEIKRIEHEKSAAMLNDRNKTPKLGLFDYVIDEETFDILQYFLEKEFDDKVLVSREDSTFYVSDGISLFDIGMKLLYYGLYVVFEKDTDGKEFPVNIRIMKSKPSNTIDDLTQLNLVLLPVCNESDVRDIKLLFTDYITNGLLKFEEYEVKYKDSSIKIEEVRDRIKSAGYKAKIVYDPLICPKKFGYTVLQINDNALWVIYDEIIGDGLIQKCAPVYKLCMEAPLKLRGKFTPEMYEIQMVSNFPKLIREALMICMEAIPIELYPGYSTKVEKDPMVSYSVNKFQSACEELSNRSLNRSNSY